MQFKQCILIAAISLIVPSAAGSMERNHQTDSSKYESCISKRNGYIGLSLGSQIFLAKKTVHWETNIPVSSIVTRMLDMGHSGFLGNIHLGYGYLLRHIFYAGGELFSEWTTGTGRSRHRGLGSSQLFIEPYDIKIMNAYGIILRLGLQVMQGTFMYVPLGVSFGRIKAINSLNIVPNLLVQRGNFSSHPGLRVGLGMMAILSTHVVFRLEYLYSHYGRFHLPMAVFTNGNSFINMTDTFPFSTHAMAAGFDVLFN